MIANVIFHAFQAPYVLALFLPLVIVVTVVVETVIYVKVLKGITYLRASLICIGANLISWLLGFFVAFVFPSGLTRKVMQRSDGSDISILTQGDDFIFLALLSFIPAFIVSVLIEGLTWKLFCKVSYKEMVKPTLLSHAASYGGALIIYLGVYLTAL